VALGITTLLPDKATLPMPWSMLTAVAPTTLQLSVEESPLAMLGGLAPNEFMIGCWVTVIPAKLQPAANTTASTSKIKGTIFFISYLQNSYLSRIKQLYLLSILILYTENYYKVIKSTCTNVKKLCNQQELTTTGYAGRISILIFNNKPGFTFPQ
jgi:hypothetical protein